MDIQEKSKQQIIKEKAAFLFRKKGYNATSMQDIAEAMDMKAASLYNHINSKKDILSSLLMNIAQEFSSGMQEILQASLTNIEKLNQLVSLHVSMTLKYSDSISLITGEWVHLEEPFLSDYKNLRDAYEKDFLSILKDCQQQGLINDAVNLNLSLYSILSTLHWLYSWYNKNDKMNRIELELQLKQILLKGILTK